MVRVFPLGGSEGPFLFFQLFGVAARPSEAFLLRGQHNLRPVGLQDPDLFAAAAFLHADGGPVFLHRGNQGNSDARVPARSLRDPAPRLQLSFLLRLFNHVQGGPVLDASAGVEAFHLCVKVGLQPLRLLNPVQVQHRRVADQLQHVFINLPHLPALPFPLGCIAAAGIPACGFPQAGRFPFSWPV